MNMRKWICALAAALSCCAVTAHASAIYSGSISGVFTAPALTGFDSDLGVLVPVNNTPGYVDPDPSVPVGAADYEGFPSNSILWGNGTFPRNQLTFTGADFTDISPGQFFHLGTITYTNGSAYVNTTIFGATLTLTLNGVDGEYVGVDPAVDQMGIVATVNYGIDARADADLLTFQAFAQTFNVFEGHTAIADVYGRIVGDPLLEMTGIVLAPNQSENGFIGNGVFLVPEPATLSLLLFGLAGLGFRRSKRA